MDWKEYEEVVKKVYNALGKEKGVKIACYGNSCKIKGKSGVEHQIDVLTEHSDGIHSYRSAIECKYWKQKINKDIVMKVAETVEDCGLSKGIIVCPEGYTPDTIKFAKEKNIGLVEFREITEKDWEGRIKEISVGIEMKTSKGPKIEIITDKETGSFSVDTNNTYLKFSDGSMKYFKEILNDFLNELFERGEEEKEFSKSYSFPENTILTNDTGELSVKVKSVKISDTLIISKEEKEISGEDYVWMRMKAIFEGEEFFISNDGKTMWKPGNVNSMKIIE